MHGVGPCVRCAYLEDFSAAYITRHLFTCSKSRIRAVIAAACGGLPTKSTSSDFITIKSSLLQLLVVKSRNKDK